MPFFPNCFFKENRLLIIIMMIIIIIIIMIITIIIINFPSKRKERNGKARIPPKGVAKFRSFVLQSL